MNGDLEESGESYTELQLEDITPQEPETPPETPVIEPSRQKVAGVEGPVSRENPSVPSVISAPIIPFDNLLAPNAKAPGLHPSVMMSNGQEELLDILYAVRDGYLTMIDAENLVDGWKRQYKDMNTGHWKKRPFTEKKVGPYGHMVTKLYMIKTHLFRYLNQHNGMKA